MPLTPSTAGKLKALGMGLLILFSPALCAAVLRVPGDHPDIEAALEAAAAGDEVLVAPGEYVIVRPITFGAKAVTLRSRAGPERTTIRMSATPEDPLRASVLLFDGSPPGTVVEGFRITGGQGTALPTIRRGGGVALLPGASARLARCIVSGNRVRLGRGGGVAVLRDAELVLTDCVVLGNHGLGGGLSVDWGTARMELTTIAGNSSSGLRIGGDQGSVELRACRVIGNHESGVRVDRGSFEAWNSVIAGNCASTFDTPSPAVMAVLEASEPSERTLRADRPLARFPARVIHAFWAASSSMWTRLPSAEAILWSAEREWPL